MENQVYKKVGRRYVPIGYSDGWSGFPCDGVWLVQTKPGHKSSECILKIGEVESLRPTADLIIGYKDEIIKHIASNPMVGVSIGDYVANMLKEVTKKQ